MPSKLLRSINYETHNLSRTSEYIAWTNAKVRCYDATNKYFKNYGGRGIKMCDRWNNSFVAFYKDMGKKPTTKHTLDRIDNNGDYSPSNCRWATRTVQSQNRRCYAKTGLRGVRKHTNSQTYYTYTRHDNKFIYLGSYKSKEEAAYMYDCFAISMYQENAKTNFTYTNSPRRFCRG